MSATDRAEDLGRRAAMREVVAAHRERLTAALAVGVLVAFVVVINLLWVRAHRRGLPFDIDEAGYLQRAIRDADALRTGGLTGLWHAFRVHDPQAPMLPITAAVVRQLTHVGPVGLIAGEQVFVAILIVATFVLARQLGADRVAAFVAAACAAALPGVIDGGRGFQFALPATALMTATLAAQLSAREFDRPGRAAFWGVLLGLSTLTRTLMLSLLPALVVAAVIRLALTRARVRQWAGFGLGLLLAAIVASTWYTATWRLVWDYLTSYGYGVHAADYGPDRPLVSWSRWTFRLVHAVNTDVYAPLTIAAIVCAAVAVSGLFRGGRTWHRRPLTVAAGFLRSGWGTVTFVVVFDYVLLSSTRNGGSYFELPLLPATAALLVSAAATSGRTGRAIALTAAAGAAAFSIVAAEGLLPGPASRNELTVGPLSAIAYDDRGPLVSYSTRFLPASKAGTESLLRRWQRSNVALADTLLTGAANRGKPVPVVFFSVQDPFVNTNSLALLAQERGISLPIGVLVPPREAGGESLAKQLQDPARGVPDVMIIGPASANPAAKQFAPTVGTAAVRKAATLDGFRHSGDVVLPDGRDMQLWWRS